MPFANKEDLKFHNRMQTSERNKHTTWKLDPAKEPKSLIPSTWPALEAAMKKFVEPGFSLRKRKCQ